MYVLCICFYRETGVDMNMDGEVGTVRLPIFPRRLEPVVHHLLYLFPLPDRESPLYDAKHRRAHEQFAVPRDVEQYKHACHKCGWLGHTGQNHKDPNFHIARVLHTSTKVFFTRYFKKSTPIEVSRFAKNLFLLAIKMVRHCIETDNYDEVNGEYELVSREGWSYLDYIDNMWDRELTHPSDLYSYAAYSIAKYNQFIAILSELNPSMYQAVDIKTIAVEEYKNLFDVEAQLMMQMFEFTAKDGRAEITKTYLMDNYFGIYNIDPVMSSDEFQDVLDNPAFDFSLPCLTPDHSLWNNWKHLRVLQYVLVERMGYSGGVCPEVLNNSMFAVDFLDPETISYDNFKMFVMCGLPAIKDRYKKKMDDIIALRPEWEQDVINYNVYERLTIATFRSTRGKKNLDNGKRTEEDAVWTGKTKECKHCGIEGHRDCTVIPLAMQARTLGGHMMEDIENRTSLYHMAFNMLDLYLIAISLRIMELEIEYIFTKKVEATFNYIARKIKHDLAKLFPVCKEYYNSIIDVVKVVAYDYFDSLPDGEIEKKVLSAMVNTKKKYDIKFPGDYSAMMVPRIRQWSTWIRLMEDRHGLSWRRKACLIKMSKFGYPDQEKSKNASTFTLATYMYLYKQMENLAPSNINFGRGPTSIKYPKDGKVEMDNRLRIEVEDLQMNFFKEAVNPLLIHPQVQPQDHPQIQPPPPLLIHPHTDIVTQPESLELDLDLDLDLVMDGFEDDQSMDSEDPAYEDLQELVFANVHVHDDDEQPHPKRQRLAINETVEPQ